MQNKLAKTTRKNYDRKRQVKTCGTGFHVQIWCNFDICGLICAFITWFLILYAEYVVIGIILYPWMGIGFWGCLNGFCFTSVSFLALVSHGKAMLTDPGAVPDNAVPPAFATASKEERLRLEEKSYRCCRRCQNFKPSRSHHCSICQRCVIKMDHHCPWVNNCVGLGNHKFFLLFIFYVCVMSFYSLILVLLRYSKCMQNTCPGNGAVLVILLVVEGILFGLFTMCMICDQYSVVSTGTTQIDRLKGEVVETLGIREVFGGSSSKFNISWLLPVNIWFPSSVKGQLLGYVIQTELEEGTEPCETDSFISSGENGVDSIVTKETLEGGWSIEKHVPKDDLQIV